MRIRTKITLIVCSLIVVLMASLGIVIFMMSASIIDKDSETLMITQLDRVQENIDLLLRIIGLETDALSLDKRVETFLKGQLEVREMNRYLTEMMRRKNEREDYYMDLFIINTEGRIIASCMESAMNLDLSQREYFKKSVGTQETVTSDILVAKSNGQMIVNTVTPVRDLKGRVLGYAATAVYAEYFSKLVSGLKLGQNGYYAIVDSNNIVLSHPDNALVGKPSHFNIGHGSFNPDNSSNKFIKRKERISESLMEIQVFKLVKNNNWILIAALPGDEMYRHSKSLMYSLFIIGFAALSIAVMIGIYVTNRISLPIEAMTRYMDVISRGNMMVNKSISDSIEILKKNYEDIDQEKLDEGVKYHNNDEIGRFKKAFQAMSKSQWAVLRKFENESRNMVQASEKLAKSIDEISVGTGRFISTLSHDLKNAVSVIKGYAKGLKLGVVESEADVKEFLDGIYSRAEELESVIYDVLDSAYEAQARIRIRREPVSLKEYTAELAESAKQYAENSGVTLICNINIKDAMIMIDRTKIRRVWNNLVSNGIKYLKPDGKITVSIVQEAEEVILSVRDEGIGIDDNEIGSIFNMFYRGSNVEQSGYGLGLYISKSIVEAHDSRLHVYSEKGRGSEFWFSLKVNPYTASTHPSG